jgi:hypothetical protein
VYSAFVYFILVCVCVDPKHFESQQLVIEQKLVSVTCGCKWKVFQRVQIF